MVEFFAHVRYLIDFVFMNEEEKQYYKYFMRLQTDDYPAYFLDVCATDLHLLKSKQFFSYTEEKFFTAVHIIFNESINTVFYEQHVSTHTSPRNELEEKIKTAYA